MIGTTVSHYRVTGSLGAGGMGVVYEATDLQLDRVVALKFLPEELAEDPDAVRRFRREAQTIAALNHPNVCAVHEIATESGAVFMAMERLEGVNLRTHMTLQVMTTAAIVDVALQVTDALHAAHAAGIVHRDIKPGNIMIGHDGRVKVLDFGLARRFVLPDSGEVIPGGSTLLGRPIGTVNYMAPERILQMPLDPRSDLFSLGVVIYEMASGQLPFSGASPSETVTNILEQAPAPLRTLAPAQPRGLEQLVDQLLAKRAEDRCASAADVRRALIAVKPADRGRLRRLADRLFS